MMQASSSKPKAAEEQHEHGIIKPLDNLQFNSAFYQRQVQQIKQLIAPYRLIIPCQSGENPIPMKQAVDGHEKHRAIEAAEGNDSGTNRGTNSGTTSIGAQQKGAETDEPQKSTQCPSISVEGTATGPVVLHDENMQQNFTPTHSMGEDSSVLIGDNKSANSSSYGNYWEAQPMTSWESSVSVINMPSPAQGQLFRDSQLQVSPCPSSHSSRSSAARPRSSHYPAAVRSPSSDPQRPGTGVLGSSGWKRNATMYTRSRCSDDFSLTDNIDSKHDSDRFRILKEDLSVKNLNTELDIELLKLKKSKELLGKKSILVPAGVPRPRAHWYEMKSSSFHLEVWRNNHHLRTM